MNIKKQNHYSADLKLILYFKILQMNLKPIKDYENYSLDLNTNQVYNTKYKRYLKSVTHADNYYTIQLSKNTKKKIRRIYGKKPIFL